MSLSTSSDQPLPVKTDTYGNGEITSQVCDRNAHVQLVDGFMKAYFSLGLAGERYRWGLGFESWMRNRSRRE